MPYRKVSWKQRNLLKIPRSIQMKIARMNEPFIVGAVIKTTVASIAEGRYAHLGVRIDAGEIVAPELIIPAADMGRWSQTNVYGHERVRKDLPMIQKTFSFESPNFGDWDRGSHTVNQTRDVYRRDYISPKQIALRIEVLEKDAQGSVTISFRCEEVLAHGKTNLDSDLLYDLNILQENTGHAVVFPAKATREDYLKTVTITWQILPPGTRDSNIEKIIGVRRSISTEARKRFEDRYDFLGTLNPKQYISGTDGFRRYFGAQYADDLVVFENVDYGNAAYVMGHNWTELSQLSRLELLAKAQRDFVRILHVDGWKKKLREAVKVGVKASRDTSPTK